MGILADFSNAEICMVSIFPIISNSSSFLFESLSTGHVNYK